MEQNKLFVGNLPYQATDESLKAHFSQAGNVLEATILTDRETGRSRGFGFVVMETDAAAQKAIQMFDQQDFDGRQLRVNVARPKEERARF
ncbi:RNA-binding protein [Candidatus Uhrbacteria bacterium]|nr:RNA-binding protein [Candidatus Uhrbacteria bacterium]